ncbi:hypothetical protein RRG08_019803 [Elysia crispata]|uniref:Uncharacterized protein n=1 Tax=Elysia crispata TaxID=231223 RepID=A0AAE1AW23_9GAST|nr:hypothetical protein RRG08_019803 [Elysia crispata]
MKTSCLRAESKANPHDDTMVTSVLMAAEPANSALQDFQTHKFYDSDEQLRQKIIHHVTVLLRMRYDLTNYFRSLGSEFYHTCHDDLLLDKDLTTDSGSNLWFFKNIRIAVEKEQYRGFPRNRVMEYTSNLCDKWERWEQEGYRSEMDTDRVTDGGEERYRRKHRPTCNLENNEEARLTTDEKKRKEQNE